MSPDSGTNVVDVYINYLRKKLAAARPAGRSNAPVIETVRGQGYRLCGLAAPVDELPDDELSVNTLEAEVLQLVKAGPGSEGGLGGGTDGSHGETGRVAA